MKKQDMGHLDYIGGIFTHDHDVITQKESMYMGSWKARGGIGAFFVTARKWDALESMLEKAPNPYDVFRTVLIQGEGDGTVIEQIRDLRRYLALIEAEIIRQNAPANKPPIEMTLKDVGGYGTGEAVNTEAVNDRPNS